MLRFGGKRPTRDYLGRREQFRLLTLFGLLALVVVLMRLAGRPESWNWFDTIAPRREAPRAARDDEPIDTRRSAISTTDASDVMRIGPTIAPGTGDATESLPGLRRDTFSSVIDDTVLRGGEEHEAFFRTLAVLSGLDERAATTPRPTEVGFVQLFRQPEAYRGEWVRVRGVVRRALPIATPKNEHGVAELRQLWLQPEGRPDDLLAVDVLQLPPGYPQGAEVEAPVTIDGVFFKRWAYHAEDGIRTAPLLLARTVTWTPEPAPSLASDEPGSYRAVDIALGVGLVVGLVAVAGWLARGKRNIRRESGEPMDLAQLAGQDQGSDVSRMLAELSARAEGEHSDGARGVDA